MCCSTVTGICVASPVAKNTSPPCVVLLIVDPDSPLAVDINGMVNGLYLLGV